MMVLGIAVMLAGGLLLVGAGAIPLFQCGRWLIKGVWTSYEVRWWGGALPLSVGTALVSFPTMTVGTLIFLGAPY